MDRMVVIDFGGQYAHLIARRFRNQGFYTEIARPTDSAESLADAKGIVLSGGPSSVYDKNAPSFNNKILELDMPILGLCYGHQLMLKEYGGDVSSAELGEFGYATLNRVTDNELLENVNFPTQVWMSHGDEVSTLPDGFITIGSTSVCVNAAVASKEQKRYGLQFHAEVRDTHAGDMILANFARICDMPVNWDDNKMLDLIKTKLEEEAGDKKILLFLSGGVDSSVTFSLLNDVLGIERVLGLHIDNGFMRKNESETVAERYKAAGFDNFIVENATDIFLDAVAGLTDPQQKRIQVGETFLTVRDQVVSRLSLNEDEWLLAQGTLYPDIIESGGSHHAEVIKTHHNRVEGVQYLLEKGLIIEPLKDLYKDEVRKLGNILGLTEELISRHPFPGPGLSINVLCSTGSDLDQQEFEDTAARLATLDLSAFIPEGESTLGVLPVKSVGVQGDYRTYTYPAVFMMNKPRLDFPGWAKLEQVSSHITNAIRAVNRTIYSFYETAECRLIEAYTTHDRLDMLREVDAIVLRRLKEKGWYKQIFQHLTIILPYAANNEHCSIVLRPVSSEDVMTARFAWLDHDLVWQLVDDIRGLGFVDALFYDITNKPPGTFGWE